MKREVIFFNFVKMDYVPAQKVEGICKTNTKYSQYDQEGQDVSVNFEYNRNQWIEAINQWQEV